MVKAVPALTDQPEGSSAGFILPPAELAPELSLSAHRRAAQQEAMHLSYDANVYQDWVLHWHPQCTPTELRAYRTRLSHRW